MAETTYRFIGKEDLEEAARIYSDVYVYGLEDARKDIKEDLEGAVGVEVPAAFVDGRMASILQIVDYTIHVGSNKLPMGGIAGVATHAEDRRKRLVAGLLKMSLERMREKGILTSMLYPFSYAFYRKYGWEHACDALHVKTKVKDLHVLKEVSPVRMDRTQRCEFLRVEVGADGQMDLDTVKSLYSAYFSQYNCAAVRGEREWTRFRYNIVKSIAGGTNNYVYVGVCRGQPVSYIAYTFRKNTNGDRTLRIREAAARDGAGWAELLGFIARHDAQAIELDGIVPMDSPIRMFFAEPGKMEITPHLMFRVVDVARFLASVEPADVPNGLLTIGVSDRTCEWNDKVFAVEVEGGRISAAPALRDEADLQMDISTLSQIASGYMPAVAAARAGLFAVNDAGALDVFAKILPARTTFCADYF